MPFSLPKTDHQQGIGSQIQQKERSSFQRKNRQYNNTEQKNYCKKYHSRRHLARLKSREEAWEN